MNQYHFVHWVMFFYIYCFIGWIFESTYVSIKEKHFVNRGFLTLPMLPIYGSGALAILLVTVPVRDNYFLVYILGVISSTVLELVTGMVMESLFKVKYWDYSNQKFNYKGYICLSSSIAWGFLSILLTDFIHRPIEKLVLYMPKVIFYVILIVISVLFIADLVCSFKAAWDLRKILERAEALKTKVTEAAEKLATKAAEAKDSLEDKAEDFLEDFQKSLDEAKDKLERFKVKEAKHWFIGHKLRSNPGATSQKFGDTLKELKEKTRRRKGE